MKNILILLACLMVSIFAVACTPAEEPINLPPDDVVLPNEPMEEEAGQKQPFEGKIAIISMSNTGANEEYDAAQMAVKKYGRDKVVHVTWPDNFMAEQEQMIKIVAKLGADPDTKAIIVHQAVPGTTAAFQKLKETREDIFVVYITPQDNLANATQIANILLREDELGMGPAMVRQAQKLGTKTFVHYSFPRHMSQAMLSTRCNLIREACVDLGLEFVDATALDSAYVGFEEANQFILDDVQKIVAKYGKDTAFFATLCSLQPSLIKAVVDTGAIYPQPCHPSPYHGLITALYPEYSYKDTPSSVKDIIAEERAALAEKNMLGRVSTWPDTSSNLLTAASVEYAIKWINDEVPKEGINLDVLKQMMEDYAGVAVFLTPYTDEYPYTENGTGETYDNFLLMRMDYITY